MFNFITYSMHLIYKILETPAVFLFIKCVIVDNKVFFFKFTIFTLLFTTVTTKLRALTVALR